MKKRILFAFAFTAYFAVAGNSQEVLTTKKSVPDWVSKDGYWVVESNIRNKKQHTIFFYNNQHQLVGRKEIKGEKLRLQRVRTKRMLKEELEKALGSWARSK